MSSFYYIYYHSSIDARSKLDTRAYSNNNLPSLSIAPRQSTAQHVPVQVSRHILSPPVSSTPIPSRFGDAGRQFIVDTEKRDRVVQVCVAHLDRDVVNPWHDARRVPKLTVRQQPGDGVYAHHSG